MTASTVPTVSSLVSGLGSDLQPVPGFSADATAVTAVHVSELQDPTGYLSGGELLLTTGLALPADRAGCDAYVARLRGAGLAALAFGLGPVHATIPPPLLDACREHGLTLLQVPPATAFLSITRAYWSALSAAGERHLTGALAAHRALVEAAASSDPVRAVLTGLARHLDGWAAVLEPSGRVAAIHPPASATEAAALESEVRRLDLGRTRSAASFAASFAGGDRFVVLFPMTMAARPGGYLAVGTRGQLDATDRRTVLTACALLGLETLRPGEQTLAGRSVAVLLDLGHPEAARALAAELGTAVPGRQVRVLVVAGESAVLLPAVVRWCPEGYGVPLAEGAWFVLPADLPAGPDLAGLDKVLAAADPRARAAASPPVGAGEVGAARARLTARLAGLAAGERDLGAPGDETGEQVRRGLDALVADGSPHLVEATAAYLRHRGNWERAARSLDRHRNTLRHQISRAVPVLGLDLDEPDVAARLWLAMRDRGLA